MYVNKERKRERGEKISNHLFVILHIIIFVYGRCNFYAKSVKLNMFTSEMKTANKPVKILKTFFNNKHFNV